MISGTGQVSHALITEFKAGVRSDIQFLRGVVFTEVPAEPPLNAVCKLSILAFNTVEFKAPFVPICLAQRSFTIALNLQSPRIPLQPDLFLPIHQNGVGNESE